MPTISRPILIALVAAVVAAVAFYATQGGDGDTEVAAPAIPAPPPADVGSEPAPEGTREHASTAGAAANEGARASDAKQGGGAGGSRRAGKGVPPAVRRALGGGKLVVLFFYERRAADDRATARGVAALRGKRDIAVFSDPIARIARYRGLIGELGISQAPAVVLVDRKRTARVIEGYIDPATLAQDVADAR